MQNCTEQGDGTVACDARPRVATEGTPLIAGAPNESDFVVTEGRPAQSDGNGALISVVPRGSYCIVGTVDSGRIQVGCLLYLPGYVTYPSWADLYAVVETFAASFQSQVYMFGVLG